VASPSDAAADGSSPDGAARDAGRPSDASMALDAAPPRDAGVPRGAPYPIVLSHGFFGFEDFAGAGFVDYFWRVRTDLAAHGETDIHTPAVDPFASSEARGAQLTAHVDRILAETGASRVVLVGHSQGGLDARVVAHARPDAVAAIVTIATPHRGSPVADLALGLVSDPQAQSLLDALTRAIAAPLYDAAGRETSVFSALRQISSAGAAALDTEHPVPEGLPFFSIGGRSGLSGGGRSCEADLSADFVSRWDRDRDPVDPLLAVTEAFVGGAFNAHPNDGLVRAEDARFGVFLGCIPADHFDEIGHLVGDRPGLGNDFDHLVFYRELVRWIRARGL